MHQKYIKDYKVTKYKLKKLMHNEKLYNDF